MLEKVEVLIYMFEKTSSDDNFCLQLRYSHQIYDALTKCNSKNTTGYDEILYILIKKLHNKAISTYLKIF